MEQLSYPRRFRANLIRDKLPIVTPQPGSKLYPSERNNPKEKDWKLNVIYETDVGFCSFAWCS
jgi:hypothetical protein